MPMNVLMGVEVCRIATEERTEALDLAVDLLVRRRVLVDEPPLAVPERPFGQVDVQADAERGMPQRVPGGRLGSRPPDHQAGARDDPMLVGVCNAVIRALAPPEVIGVDDQCAVA